jgi:hypothetical protein
MSIDPKLVEQARSELANLVILGEVGFEEKPKHADNSKYVFVGMKFKPTLYRWVKLRSNQYTGGNVGGFIKSLLQSVKDKEEDTHHASKSTRKRLPS